MVGGVAGAYWRAMVLAVQASGAMLAGGASGVLAQDIPISAKEIVVQLVVDFDQDGVPDRLVFTQTPDDGMFATLHVFKGSKDPVTGRQSLSLLSKTDEFGFGVHTAKELRKGVIAIQSANAQGRYKWEQTLTLAWRANRLVVLGITRTGYDSISDDEDKGNTSCDLNLATGKGFGKRNRPIKVTLKPVPVAEWTDDQLPDVCSD